MTLKVQDDGATRWRQPELLSCQIEEILQTHCRLWCKRKINFHCWGSHWDLGAYLLLQHSLSYSYWHTALLKYLPVPSWKKSAIFALAYKALHAVPRTPLDIPLLLLCSLCSNHASLRVMPKHPKLTPTVGQFHWQFFLPGIFCCQLLLPAVHHLRKGLPGEGGPVGTLGPVNTMGWNWAMSIKPGATSKYLLRERGTRTTLPRALCHRIPDEQPEAPRPVAELDHPTDMTKSGLELGFNLATRFPSCVLSHQALSIYLNIQLK